MPNRRPHRRGPVVPPGLRPFYFEILTKDGARLYDMVGSLAYVGAIRKIQQLYPSLASVRQIDEFEYERGRSGGAVRVDDVARKRTPPPPARPDRARRGGAGSTGTSDRQEAESGRDRRTRARPFGGQSRQTKRPRSGSTTATAGHQATGPSSSPPPRPTSSGRATSGAEGSSTTGDDAIHLGDESDKGKALQVLGIDPSALEDWTLVRKAYREQLGRYHPDKVLHLGEEFRDIAEQKTKHILWAYRVLEGFRKKD